MNRMLAGIAGVAMLAALAACTPSTEKKAVDEPVAKAMMTAEGAYADAVTRWDEAIRSGDIDGMLAQYEPAGAMLSPPEGPTAKGADAMRAFFGEMFEEGGLDVTNTLSRVLEGGDHVAGRGTYVLNLKGADGKPYAQPGSWVGISRRQADGSVLMIHNIWNRDTPTPGADPPMPIAESGPQAATDVACAATPTALDQYYEASFEGGDVEALVALHAEDGMRMPPDMPAMEGRSAISRYFVSRVNPFSKRVLDLTDLDAGADGALGWTTGKFRADYTPKKDVKRVQATGTYMTVSAKGDDGCWRYEWVIWNSDAPRKASP